jgi:hypothetical protein
MSKFSVMAALAASIALPACSEPEFTVEDAKASLYRQTQTTPGHEENLKAYCALVIRGVRENAYSIEVRKLANNHATLCRFIGFT